MLGLRLLIHSGRPVGTGTPSCLQIARASNGLISRWRGTALRLSVGPTQRV